MDPGDADARKGGLKGDKPRAKTPGAKKRKVTPDKSGAAAANSETRLKLSHYLSFSEHSQLLAALLIVCFAAVVHSRLLPRVADVDSFYHLRHAWVYRTNGMFDCSFPWAQYSSVKTYAADICYGFHFLIIPLTLLDPLLGGPSQARRRQPTPPPGGTMYSE